MAGFQPLEDGKEYYITDLLNRFKMPFNAQFVEPEGVDVRADERPPCQPFQSIYLDGIANETIITATSLNADGKHDRVISPHLAIGVVVCEEAFRHSSEHENILRLFSPDNERRSDTADPSRPDPETYQELDSIYEDIDKYTKCPTDNNKISISSAPNKVTPSSEDYEIPVEGLPENFEKPTDFPSKAASELPKKDVPECPDFTYYTSMDPPYIVDEDYQPPTAEHQSSFSQSKTPVEDRDTEGKPENKSSKTAGELPKKALPKCSDSTYYTTMDSPYFVDEDYEPPRVERRSSETPNEPPLPKENIASQIERVAGSNSEPDHDADDESLYIQPDPKPPKPDTQPERPTIPVDPDASPSALTPEQEREEIYQELARYPIDLTGLDLTGVGRLLKCLGMGKYVEIFKDEMIDGQILADMDKESLQSLSVSPFHIKKLLNFIGGWRPNKEKSFP